MSAKGLDGSGSLDLTATIMKLTGSTMGAGPPAPVTGPFYVAATGGDDSRSCTTAQTISTPLATIPQGLTCLDLPGQTLWIRAGTYPLQLSTTTTPIVGGTNWDSATQIRAYDPDGDGPAAPETVVLALPASGGANTMFAVTNANDKYIILKDLEIDCGSRVNSNGLFIDNGAHHIRVENVHAHHCFYDNLYFGLNADGVQVLGGEYHHAQSATLGANIRFGKAHVGALVRGATLHDAPLSCLRANNDNATATTHSGLLVEDVCAYNCGDEGLVFGRGTQVQLQNSVVYGAETGLRLTTGLTNSAVYHTTVTDNTVQGILCEAGAAGITLTNNIAYNNVGAEIVNTCGATLTTNLTTDPTFVNAAAHDYQLHNTSSAIDAGTLLVAVPEDLLGTSRTAFGTAPDIGAYESTNPPPPDPTPPPGGLQPPARLTTGFFRR